MASTSTSNLDNIADAQPEGYYLSKKFRSSDADVTFQSSDKVRFHVYKKDLATFSGGFPPAELVIDDRKEIVDLSEGGVVLDFLFSFCRAGRYPDIDTLEIGTLLGLANAAEKYEVYSAVMACKILMKVNLSTHPFEVFLYAAKNQYMDLLDATAIYVLGTPLLQLFRSGISMHMFEAWLRYLEALEPRRKIWIDKATTSIKRKCEAPLCQSARTCLVRELAVQMPSMTDLLKVNRQILAKSLSEAKSYIDIGKGLVILNLLYFFTCPRPYPDLRALDIETLVELRDAAEKYEISGAINACNIAMRTKISTHPLQVFQYAGKYQITDLLDEAAPSLLETPLLEILDLKLPEDYFRAWVSRLKRFTGNEAHELLMEIRYLGQFESERARERWLQYFMFTARQNCQRCTSHQDYIVKRIGIKMPNKTSLIEMSRPLCAKCSCDAFSPDGLEHFFSGAPQKFSTFL
ncbi:hypothetical protein BDN72DRAFT_901824 [Pluteus cervinus]|uniref:Uncharacterized protein n=1 Tax=Pluteus cervinus TaxID=181527 RepID=A0ACD3AEQ8_9AGAR|nr:hypothetical protein BDN72DRAFT_901824 [Pluteus cervinus]